MNDTGLPHWHENFAASCDVTTATVYARGSLDLFTVEYLRGAIDILRRAGHLDLLLHAADITSIDHAGAAYLHQLTRDLRDAGGNLTIEHLPDPLTSCIGGTAEP